MGPFETLSAVGRRTMAVGAWILLALMIGLIPSTLSVWTSIGLVIPVSISSAVSLLLISEDWRTGFQRPGWIRSISVGVSLAIPVGWAICLGSRSSFQTVPFLSILSVFPTLIACQMLGRMSGSDHQADLIDSIESPVAENPISKPLKFAEPSLEQDEPEPVELGLVSESETSVPADVTQWLTRSLKPDGEMIEGGIRVDFQEGQRDATVHVSFCPPLDCIPQVMTEDLDGADLEIRVAATFKFGARLAVRRQQASHFRGEKLSAGSFRIGFVAVASTTRRVA